jgi:hypothetical protein
LVLAACSGGGKPKVTRSTASSTETTDASESTGSTRSSSSSAPTLSKALCLAYAEDRSRREINAKVDIATLSLTALQARFAGANSSLQAMVDAATGDLADALAAQLEALEAGQAMLETAWGETGAALAEEARAAGFHDISSYVTRGGITLPDGRTVTVSAVGRLVVRNLSRLEAGCEDPLLAVRENELRPVPPGGAIVYTDGGTTTQKPTLQLVAPDGSDGREVVAPGEEGRYAAVVGPDGAVAFVAFDDAGTSVLRVATSLDTVDRATDVQVGAECPSWAPGRHRLVASVLDSVDDRGVYLVDDGRPVAVALPFPVLDTGCAVFVTDDELLVSRTVFGGGVELWRVPLPSSGAAGSVPTMVFERHDCRGSLGGVSPDGATAALAFSCGDVRSDGVHLVDLATGHDEHLVTAIVPSGPRWSPDGQWLVLSSCPFGCDTAAELRITVVRADGTGSRPIVDGESTWPSWVPPSAAGGANPRT